MNIRSLWESAIKVPAWYWSRCHSTWPDRPSGDLQFSSQKLCGFCHVMGTTELRHRIYNLWSQDSPSFSPFICFLENGDLEGRTHNFTCILSQKLTEGLLCEKACTWWHGVEVIPDTIKMVTPSGILTLWIFVCKSLPFPGLGLKEWCSRSVLLCTALGAPPPGVY